MLFSLYDFDLIEIKKVAKINCVAFIHNPSLRNIPNTIITYKEM